MLAEQLGFTAAKPSAVSAAYAYLQGRRLMDAAADIVGRRLRLPPRSAARRRHAVTELAVPCMSAALNGMPRG